MTLTLNDVGVGGCGGKTAGQVRVIGHRHLPHVFQVFSQMNTDGYVFVEGDQLKLLSLNRSPFFSFGTKPLNGNENIFFISTVL